MIVIGLFLFGLACVGIASERLGDDARAPDGESFTYDAILFLLCFVGVVYAHHKKTQDDEF